MCFRHDYELVDGTINRGCSCRRFFLIFFLSVFGVLIFLFFVLFIVTLMKYPFVDTTGVPRLGVDFSFEPVHLPDATSINMVQTIGSHNSYKGVPSVLLHSSFKYEHEPLLTQVRVGVRNFELDVHVASYSRSEFRIHHLQLFDDKTTCRSVSECLGPIYGWSQSVGGLHGPLYFMFDVKTLDLHLRYTTSRSPLN